MKTIKYIASVAAKTLLLAAVILALSITECPVCHHFICSC
nr:MAG TPA: hypothetical protein [Caudoviricetes sp.]